ncbi:MAG: redoxin domain-containing protein [Lewinellaceae bacterium]|nr:redoxin domain-containing protein [Lewinellaceae bacterium]
MLPRFCLVIAAFCLVVTGVQAQIVLSGALHNPPSGAAPEQLALEYWETDHWQLLSKIALSPDLFFYMSINTPPGQYRMRVWGQPKMWSYFIISADAGMVDSLLEFDLDGNTMEGYPSAISHSAANTLYGELMDRQRSAADTSTAGANNALLQQKRTASNAYCMDLAARYRNTLIGDIALLMVDPQPSDYNKPSVSKMTANEFAKANALDKIPFNHANILHHYGLLKALNRYFNYFERSEAGGKAFIDGVMVRRNGNEEADGYLFRYLLNKMMDYKNDGALSYLLAWYAPDCTEDSPLPDATTSLIEALKTCAPGNTAPEIAMPDPSGNSVSLSEVCAQHKITLMLFWRSNCSHCKEFEPELLSIYQKYHPLGVEVYALSLDKDTDTWTADLSAHPTPWVNVFIPKVQRSEISRKFPAPGTPTLIALDQQHRVLSRVLSRANLSAYLDETLAKVNGH